MKIAHVVRYLPESPYKNGLEVAIIQLHQNLKELGHNSKIIAIKDPNLFNDLEKFDKVIIHFRRSSALRVIKWCRKYKKSTYLVCHNGIGNIWYHYPNLLKRFLVLFSESYYLYRKISGTIVLNSEDHHYLHTWFPKLKKKQIYWGIDQNRFSLKNPSPFYQKLNLKGDEFLILYPSRIHPGKNLTLPLKIWDEIATLYPKAHLIFMGYCGKTDNKYYETLKIQASNIIHKERIHWINDVSYEDEMLINAYSAASIVILPSFKESFGLVLLEAAAIGKPIVTTPVGIAPSLIKNGINGFLCGPHDETAWKNSLITLLENAGLRKILGDNLKKEILKKYSWKQTTLEILEWINSS